MTSRQLAAIAAGFIVFMTLIYAIARWWKAPAAFKAIVWVGAANLAAGALIGFWTVRVFDSHAPSVAGAPSAIFPGGVPSGSSGVPPSPSKRAVPILNAYVGQALAQGWAKDPGLSSMERWPQVDEGCRLCNYQRASPLCKAAALAVHGWDDTQAVSREELANFCDEGYLEKLLYLCRTAYKPSERPVSSTGPRPSSVGRSVDTGVPESDVAQELAKGFLRYGPRGEFVSWRDVLANCASGLYAPASPICEAAHVEEKGTRATVYIAYGEVASFCDLELIYRESEVCRAAYHFADASGDDTP